MNDSTNRYLNKTILENDPFEPISEEDSQNIFNTTGFNTFFVVHQIVTESLEVIGSLIAMFACIFLAITILRSEKLKSSRTNVYILNTSILYIIQAPLFIFMFSEYVGSVILFHAYATVLMLYMVFGFFLGLDWLLAAKRPNWICILDRYQTFVIAISYVIATFEWVITFWYAKEHHVVRVNLLLLLYSIILIGSILLNIIKVFSKLDPNSSDTSYAFFCFNVMVFSMTPLLIYHFLYHALESLVLIVLTAFFPILVLVLHPLFVVYLLGRQNRSFRIGYIRTFAFLKGDSRREELDESDSDDTNPNGSQIQFTAVDEELVLTENADAKNEVFLR